MINVTLGVIVGVTLGVIGSYGYARYDHNILWQFIDDDNLLAECETRDIPRYQDPVETIQSLEDDQNAVYVWKVEDEQARRNMMQILETHQDEYGGFDALHAVTVNGESELWQLEKEELEGYL